MNFKEQLNRQNDLSENSNIINQLEKAGDLFHFDSIRT